MTFPAIIFGFMLSAAYGTAFHFIRGGTLKKLFLFIVLSWMGFWVGHILGTILDWDFLRTGPIYTGMATIGSFVFLLVGEWLSRVEIKKV
jgi:hypothetical protein